MKPIHAVVITPMHSGCSTDTVILTFDTAGPPLPPPQKNPSLSVVFRGQTGKTVDYLRTVLGLSSDDIEIN